MPIDYSKYPANWRTEIRPAILERDGHKCKFCGVPNKERGNRDVHGSWWSDRAQSDYLNEMGELPDGIEVDTPMIRIVLTVAHLDHDISNNDPGNLAALCQRCHLRYDAEHHAKNAKATRDRKAGLVDMLEAPDADRP